MTTAASALIADIGATNARFALLEGMEPTVSETYAVADYAQNFAVARLLSDFQSANPDSLAFASLLTVTKFALLAIPVFVIAIFALAGQRRR